MEQGQEVNLHVGVDEGGGGGEEEAEGGHQLKHGWELLLQDNLVEGVVEDEGLEWGVSAQLGEVKPGGWETQGGGGGEAGGGGAQQGGFCDSGEGGDSLDCRAGERLVVGPQAGHIRRGGGLGQRQGI